MEEYLTQITNYLLTQSWQIAVLVVVIAAVSVLLKNRSAHVRYLLWLIVLAKCLVPPLISVPLAILPEDKPVVMPVTVDTTRYERVILPSAPIVMSPAPTVAEEQARFTIREWCGVGWIVGAAVFVLAAGIKALRTNLWLWRERKPLPGELHERIATSLPSLEFMILPKVWLVDGIGQPFVWGLLRGGIYLPANFVKADNGEHRRDVLGHEVSHVLRFDAAVNLLQIIAQAIFWFHPFVWWANKKIRAEREKCCDEMAIARLGTKAKDYSSAIVDTLITEYESTRPIPSLAIAGPVKNIEERIKTIMRPGKKFYKRPTFTAAIAVLLAAAIAVPTTLALTRRQAAKADAQAEQAKREADEEIQQRMKSVERLMGLGKALLIYANDYEDRYPDSMRQLESYYIRRDAVDDFKWLENVRYLGKGKSITVPPGVVIAYDRILLETDKGTNVLFNDSHVEFVEYGRLEEFGIAERSNIKVLDVKFEPIREGKNVVHAEVRNSSPQDQVLGVYIQTRSPDRGWGTTFTDTIKAGQTKWIRHAYKIFDSITPDTWVRLQFYNPGPAAGFSQEGWFSSEPWDSWFKKVKYFGNELEHYRSGESQLKPASKSQAQAITKTLSQLQHHIRNKDYQAAWQLFTQDFREAEFQRRGFERFKECMENPQNFYLSRMELLALEPKSVNIRDGVFALTAAMRDEYRRVDLVNVDGRWKIDSIERVIPSELEVLDIKFEPIHQGKNVVHLKVKNSSNKGQTFGVDIRAEAPIRNWQRQFLDTIKGAETKSTSFDFEILGPITDAISIRLRFYNPPSADEFDINKWFKKIRYSYKDLDQLGILRDRSEPASESQAEAIRNTFRQFQSHLKEGNYEAVWGLLAKHIRSDQLQDDFEKFKKQFSNDSVKTVFLNLYPESVTKSGKFLTLSAKHEDQTWKIHFIMEDGQWKIYEGQEPDRGNWQERLLPKMQKRVIKHFDIYYFKDSTAEREIEQIAEQKERGFEQICRFLGKDSDVRIRMVFFEDGETKQRQTGHQGAGWAFGNTIVEVYNEKEKLDPYHETTHVLMRPFGNPPALFNEGFAVYMSERLGAHALKNLGGGLVRIHQRAGGLKEQGQWIDLEELVTYTEIGSRESRPPVSYAEAASFVKFVIDSYGKDKFLRAYKALRNSNDKRVHKQNADKLADIYGKSLQQLERQWHDALPASPDADSFPEGAPENKKTTIRMDAHFLLVPRDASEVMDFLERENLESSKIQGDPNSRSYLLNAEQVEQLLELARRNAEYKVLMAPTLEVFDDHKATVTVMKAIHYTSGYSEPNRPSEEPKPIQDSVETGAWLHVKPKLQVDGRDTLIMDLDFEISNITGYEEFIYREKYPYEIPIIEKVAASTRYTIAPGQTLLLCGCKVTEKQDGRTEQKDLLVLVKAEKAEP